MTFRPEPTRRASRGLVCTVDHLASVAGVRLLAAGGSAADAAVAASAALAVTTQHMCGMGGDLWALVHHGVRPPAALNASGRAGSGADAEALRREGATEMPFRGDIRSVPVPGCVDGWVALHERYGRLPLADVLAPAIELAELGFPASPLLAASVPLIAEVAGNEDFVGADGGVVRTGDRVRRPRLARALHAIALAGRHAWYRGEFGEGLLRVGDGQFTPGDLERLQADWVDPLVVSAWGHDVWTVPPNSQGYLSLAGAWIADGLDLPDDPGDPAWVHLLVEAAKQAAHDRPAVLSDRADGAALVSPSRLEPRRALISAERASSLRPPTGGGGTVYLCASDGEGQAVSLIQSNASGFGAHITVPELGVFLHNRGIGFSLEPGHPAELAPGRRPPSTLAPALVTGADGALRAVLGTMGGDGQPQTVLQMLAHLLHGGRSPGFAVSAPRFALTRPDASGFDTWSGAGELVVAVESGHPRWADGLRSKGHLVREEPWGAAGFGHAHLIEADRGQWAGCADPRAQVGAAIGI